MDIFKQANWLDIAFIILLLRGGYVAVCSGLHIEIFKFCGTVLAAYASLHYYSGLSLFLRVKIFGKGKHEDIFNLLAFTLLALGAYGLFVLLRNLFCRLIKMEAAPDFDKWGGFALGVAKSFIFASLLAFMLVVSNIGYLKNSVKGSYVGSRIFQIAPAAYVLAWDSIVSKLMPEEKINGSVVSLRKDISGKEDIAVEKDIIKDQ